MNDKTVLKFCILCGQKVKPYHYSRCAYPDVSDYGNTYDSTHYKEIKGNVTYYCSCTKSENLAPNTENTGCFCPDCGHFMPLFVSFCGVCSKKLNY